MNACSHSICFASLISVRTICRVLSCLLLAMSALSRFLASVSFDCLYWVSRCMFVLYVAYVLCISIRVDILIPLPLLNRAEANLTLILAHHNAMMSEHASQTPPASRPTTTRKPGLWSYILPASPAQLDAHPPPPSSLPTPGPADRNTMSARLMLADTKAALQQLSERVERVVREAADARREVAEAARGAEEAQAALVKQVHTAGEW
jgi:hypothetical protein